MKADLVCITDDGVVGVSVEAGLLWTVDLPEPGERGPGLPVPAQHHPPHLVLTVEHDLSHPEQNLNITIKTL